MKPSDKEILECPYKKPCGMVPCVTEGVCPKDDKSVTFKWPEYWGSTWTGTGNPYPFTTYEVTCSQ